MAKKNANTVSVLPIRNNLFARILHAYDLTIEEYLGLKSCTPGIKSSECTARQRLMLQQLKQRGLVKVVEYPHLFEGPAWVPDAMGEPKLEGVSLFAREQEVPINSSQETSRSRGRRSVARRRRT
jgi:hypothetical protein